MKSTYIFILLLIISSIGFSQNRTLYQKQWFVSGKDTLPLRILYPENMDSRLKYPVVIVLHGSGERGNDNEAQLK